MPQELMKEFMDKVCIIILFNESFGVQGKIVAIEDNWIKVEEKNKTIGFAILGTGLPNSFCGHDVFIEEFYVKREYRRKGYGTEMVRLIVDSYPSMDFSAFILEYNTIAIEFWGKVFDFLGYSERTSVGNIRAKGNNTVFKYWALYLPF